MLSCMIQHTRGKVIQEIRDIHQDSKKKDACSDADSNGVGIVVVVLSSCQYMASSRHFWEGTVVRN